MKISAVIMAAGNSVRMGENKLLLNINGQELIKHFLNNFSTDLFTKTVIVYAHEKVGKIAEEHGLTAVRNLIGGLKNTTIKLGTEACRCYEGIMFFTADQPFTKRSTVQKLIDTYDKRSIVIPECAGKRHNPVLFPPCVYEDLMALSGDRGGRDVMDRHKDICCEVSFNDEPQFIDIDTPEDVEYAKDML